MHYVLLSGILFEFLRRLIKNKHIPQVMVLNADLP